MSVSVLQYKYRILKSARTISYIGGGGFDEWRRMKMNIYRGFCKKSKLAFLKKQFTKLFFVV